MRLSELIGKEIINIYDGMRMGTAGEADLMVDQETGEIVSMVLPNQGNLLTFWADRQHIIIPWEAVKKIGREVIVVELDKSYMRLKNHSV